MAYSTSFLERRIYKTWKCLSGLHFSLNVTWQSTSVSSAVCGLLAQRSHWRASICGFYFYFCRIRSSVYHVTAQPYHHFGIAEFWLGLFVGFVALAKELP